MTRSTGSRRDAFDAFTLGTNVHDALHEDTGQMHLFGIDRSGLDQLLNLRNRYSAGHRAERIEVAGRFVKYEIAGAISDRRAYHRVIAYDAHLHDVLTPVEDTRLLFRGRESDAAVRGIAPGKTTICDERAVARRREERRNAATPRTQPFGQSALRDELHFEFAAEVLPFELLVLADVRARGAPNAAVIQENAQSPTVHAAVVGDGNQVAGALLEQRLDEIVRYAVEAEATDRERSAVGNIRHGLGAGGVDLLHAALMRRRKAGRLRGKQRPYGNRTD